MALLSVLRGVIQTDNFHRITYLHLILRYFRCKNIVLKHLLNCHPRSMIILNSESVACLNKKYFEDSLVKPKSNLEKHTILGCKKYTCWLKQILRSRGGLTSSFFKFRGGLKSSFFRFRGGLRSSVFVFEIPPNSLSLRMTCAM